MSSDTTIDRIEAFSCTVPLERPIDLGTYTVAERHYSGVRIHLSGGFIGEVVSLTRKAPVDVFILDILAPRLIGVDAMALADCDVRLDRCTAGMERVGVLSRARSLVDIALHDIRAKATGQPLWRLLGGRSDPIEVLLVEGYRMADEASGALAERLLERVAQGYKRLKIEIGSYGDPAKLVELLDLFRRQSSDTRIALDALWRWKNFGEAARFLAAVREFDIDWVEDPFPPEMLGAYRRLTSAGIVPVAAGDDMTNPKGLEDLRANGIDIMRLDVTTIGGIKIFQELAHRARRTGVSISPHFYPQIHQQLAFGWNLLDHVEIIPTDRSFDQTHALLAVNAFDNVKGGLLHPPEEVGAGYQLDMSAVERWCWRRATVH